MNRQRLDMLKRMQELEFACIDLNLYLDTHPMDQRALMDHRAYVHQLMMVKKQYESIYGPLTACSYVPNQWAWQYIDDPWPWEIEY